MAIQQAHPTATVEVWAMDEHRIGLKPILRRVWTKRGKRPIAIGQHRYQWMYLLGFVQPLTGQTHWQTWSGVGTDIFSMALYDFARQVHPGPDKQVVILLDRAGWHTSPAVQLPAGVHLLFLPAYSPELQPAERLWPLTNEAIANRWWADLETLHAAQGARCLTLQGLPDLVRQYTLYHWWPGAPA